MGVNAGPLERTHLRYSGFLEETQTLTTRKGLPTELNTLERKLCWRIGTQSALSPSRKPL